MPVKALPIFKEGTYGTAGSGILVIIKNRPHPNATKVFVNWLLSKEGQEVWTKSTEPAHSAAGRGHPMDRQLRGYSGKGQSISGTVEQGGADLGR